MTWSRSTFRRSAGRSAGRLLAAFAVLAVSAPLGGGPAVLASAAPAESSPTVLPAAPRPQITVRAPGGPALTLEIAADEPSRERGLMFRRSLPRHSGMLFVFPSEGEVTFWMKNTLIPLDMVFVLDDGTVGSIAAGVPATAPDTADARIPRRSGFARYVIELPAGEAARDGIHPGDRLVIPPLH